MKSNIFKYIFIIFVIGILIFSFFKIKKDEEEKNKNQTEISEVTKNKITEINLGISGFDTINPITSTNKNIQDIEKLIFEPLVDLTKEYKAKQCLAIEWAKQNGTSYLIKLKKGVKWSNGTNFTAEDVKFTIDKLKETQSIYTSNVKDIIGIDVVDEHTIRINLGKEVPFFEYNLTFPIVSAANYGTENLIVGTGKYKINNIQEANIILDQNTNWWDKENTKLTLEKITINKYATLGEMYNAFKIGNIDLINSSNENIQEYIGKIGYNEKQIQGREHTFISFNTQNPLLGQTPIRKSIAYSIDKENIVSSIFNNKYNISGFPLEYGNWIYQSQNSSGGYNPDQGKQVLVDNGWNYKNKNWQKYENRKTQKLTFNLLTKASNKIEVAIAENIKTQLDNQGIRIEIVYASDNQYINAINTKGYDIAICSMYTSPSPSLETFFGENNLANYANEEVNELMKEVKNTTDENVLKKDYQKLGEIYKNESPYISICTNKYIIAHNLSLSGEITPNWFNCFYNIETWSK